MTALLVFALVGLGAYLMWYWSAAEQVKRELRAAKLFRIAELPEDTLGRVVGAARPVAEALAGPLTGRPCVYYLVQIREKSGKSWRTIITESRSVPFVLEDGSGRAIIDPRDASVALDFDGRSTSGSFDDATPVEEAFLARHGHASKGWMFNKGIQYLEAVIHVGETIAILGSAVREPDPDAPPGDGYREGPPTRLRFMSSSKYALRISDDISTTARPTTP